MNILFNKHLEKKNINIFHRKHSKNTPSTSTEQTETEVNDSHDYVEEVQGDMWVLETIFIVCRW